MKQKTTLVIGASTNPARYSYKAIHKLKAHGHEVIALAKREGQVADVSFRTEFPADEAVDTVTLYVGPGRQTEYVKPLVDLKPRRVIFNPGTENEELKKKLDASGVETIENCTLVMLGTGKF